MFPSVGCFSAIAKVAIMDHIDTKGSTVNCTWESEAVLFSQTQWVATLDWKTSPWSKTKMVQAVGDLPIVSSSYLVESPWCSQKCIHHSCVHWVTLPAAKDVKKINSNNFK